MSWPSKQTVSRTLSATFHTQIAAACPLGGRMPNPVETNEHNLSTHLIRRTSQNQLDRSVCLFQPRKFVPKRQSISAVLFKGFRVLRSEWWIKEGVARSAHYAALLDLQLQSVKMNLSCKTWWTIWSKILFETSKKWPANTRATPLSPWSFYKNRMSESSNSLNSKNLPDRSHISIARRSLQRTGLDKKSSADSSRKGSCSSKRTFESSSN